MTYSSIRVHSLDHSEDRHSSKACSKRLSSGTTDSFSKGNDIIIHWLKDTFRWTITHFDDGFYQSSER